MSSSPKRFAGLVNSRFFAAALSALVFPGAGQCAQKRWGMAAMYGGLFVATAAWFAIEAGRAIYSYYRFAFEFETAPDPGISYLAVLLPFGACMLVWGANVLDALVASFRRPRPSDAGASARPPRAP